MKPFTLTAVVLALIALSVGTYIADGSFARILGPWLLMGIGLILLAVLYLPARQDPERR